jgi:hypothetical protein
MVTNVSIGKLATRELVLAVIKDAQDLGDRIFVWQGPIVTRAEDWLSSKVVYGNGGEMTVAQTGEVLLYEPSEEVPKDHDGYFDIIHIELEQWRLRHGLTWSETGPAIDILMVGLHTIDGVHLGAVFEPSIDMEDNVDAA